MQIEMLKVKDLVPYERNPRNNKEAVEFVANSIKEFGFKNPIIIDKDNVIVAGHTRLLAAKKLKIKEVPCVRADDLTDEQVKAFRIADNSTAQVAEWDFDLLKFEIEDLPEFDFADFGLEPIGGADIDWANVEDLSEETYEEPQKVMLRCPHCNHIDSKTHFLKVE